MDDEIKLIHLRGPEFDAGVPQLIVEPRREHSRKPDCVYDRIERLVAGPYLELFARARRANWEQWGNELGKFDANQRPGKTRVSAARASNARAELSAVGCAK